MRLGCRLFIIGDSNALSYLSMPEQKCLSPEPIRAFGMGLRHDLDAVVHALTLPRAMG